MSRTRKQALVALAVLVVVAGARAAEPAGKDALERFRKMTAEERLRWVEKQAGAGAFAAVRRADLDAAVVERGVVESADVSDVVARVKGGATIKWVTDDGTAVKKGQRLLELDDAKLREQLREQEVALDQATAARQVARKHLELARARGRLAARAAEVELREARLALKRYAGKDAEEKEILKLKVEKAELAALAAKLQGEAGEAEAEAAAKARAVTQERELKRKREIEVQVAACVMRAEQDGIVVYHVPEVTRLGGGEPVVAVGARVRQGQKLMRVCGLDRFVVSVRVHEAQVSRVRPGQQAVVRVDAFPNQPLRARVKEVSPVAAEQDWLRADVKVYPTVLELVGPPPRLRPGMSAGTRIELGRRPRVLQVPVAAVLREGRDVFCYVKVGKGLQERKVTTGDRDESFLEVRGLKEDEEVLRDPAAALGLTPKGRGAGGRGKR